jgi:uncharacterized tellurite resistance protein B-like protein
MIHFLKTIFSLKSTKEKADYIHIKNLFLVATADGRLEDKEIEFILHIAEEMKVPQDTVKEIYKNLNDIPSEAITCHKRKFDLACDLIYLCLADGPINDAEVFACKNIFIQLGYAPALFEILLYRIYDLNNKRENRCAVRDLIQKQIVIN